MLELGIPRLNDARDVLDGTQVPVELWVRRRQGPCSPSAHGLREDDLDVTRPILVLIDVSKGATLRGARRV
jgi:hypothetical protein